jgi:hypothetical protein
MLRFLWKCVLEVLPPTCATVVAGILLSAYHEHIIGLQSIIDPRASLEQVATPAPEGSKQQQAVVVAPQVPAERAAEPVETGGKSPTPGPDANSPMPAREGDPADVKTSEKAPEVSDTKATPAGPTDAQASQLNAVLMDSSPMSQPPAEIKAVQPLETKGSEGTAAASESAAADGPSVGPGDPAQASQPTDVSPTAAKPGAAKSPDTQPVTPVLQPHLSRHVTKPVRKGTAVKMESGRSASPVVAMVPLPPPAAPPMVTMELPPQVSPSRSVLPSRALPTPPQAPAPPQAIGPTPPQVIGPTPPQVIGPTSSPPIVPNPGMVGAVGPTGPQSLPGAPRAGANAGQEGVAKTSEPTRVFGVPIPPTIVAVGDALDPRPVFSAGQKAFEKIVTTAKSVVPDFGHEP